jgi:hypothetical protein
MSTHKVLALVSVAALLVSPAAFSFDRASDANGRSVRVLGEKLDSGLGDLPSSYTAEEFRAAHVAGEKLDSGLGDLSPEYTAAEFQTYRIAGESLDSGLGNLPSSYTAAEFQKSAQVIATR